MKFTTYVVEIGDSLWCAIYSYLEATHPHTFAIRGMYEEEGQKFALLQNRGDNKLYRLNFSWANEELYASVNTEEVPADYVAEDQLSFSLDDNDNFKKKEEEDDSDKGEDADAGKGQEEQQEEDDEKKDKKKYSLDEIPEYVELNSQYSAKVEENERLTTRISELENEVAGLKQFKLEAERVEKQAKIDEFFMLSDEDKADVVQNIDKYSLDDIEAKLSVICFRNKVSFAPSENGDEGAPIATAFNLNSLKDTDNSNDAPEWVQSVLRIQNEEE